MHLETSAFRGVGSVPSRLKSWFLPWVFSVQGLVPVVTEADEGGGGLLAFSTRVPGQVEARVVRWTGEWPSFREVPADSRFVAQLQVGRAGGTLVAVGSPVPFRDAPEQDKGYILDGGVVAVPGVPPGEEIDVRMVAWLRAYGATWEEAAGLGLGSIGMGPTVRMRTGGGEAPPAILAGLRGFLVTRLLAEGADLLGPGPRPVVRWVANGVRRGGVCRGV